MRRFVMTIRSTFFGILLAGSVSLTCDISAADSDVSPPIPDSLSSISSSPTAVDILEASGPASDALVGQTRFEARREANIRGIVYFRNGKVDKAVSSFEEALAYDPGNPVTELNLKRAEKEKELLDKKQERLAAQRRLLDERFKEGQEDPSKWVVTEEDTESPEEVEKPEELTDEELDEWKLLSKREKAGEGEEEEEEELPLSYLLRKEEKRKLELGPFGREYDTPQDVMRDFSAPPATKLYPSKLDPSGAPSADVVPRMMPDLTAPSLHER